MDYLKREINRLLPLALLFGAFGGVLLIIAGNVFEANKLVMVLSYIVMLTLSVYSLNRMRYKKEVKGSLLYGFIVYAVMTIIAYIDLLMNADRNFINPLFEQLGFFCIIFFGSFLISGTIVYLFRRQVIS